MLLPLQDDDGEDGLHHHIRSTRHRSKPQPLSRCHTAALMPSKVCLCQLLKLFTNQQQRMSLKMSITRCLYLQIIQHGLSLKMLKDLFLSLSRFYKMPFSKIVYNDESW